MLNKLIKKIAIGAVVLQVLAGSALAAYPR